MKRNSTITIMLASAFALALVSCGGNRNKPATETPEPEKREVAVTYRDYGPEPLVLDIEAYTVGNDHYRQTLWTGTNFQLTIMSIPAGEDIGLEMHPDIDQFLRVEQGKGRVEMGDAKESMTFTEDLAEDFVILVPAGKWHNIINTGDKPLKLYSIYAPVEHPHGTVHATRAEAMEAEHGHHHE